MKQMLSKTWAVACAAAVTLSMTVGPARAQEQTEYPPLVDWPMRMDPAPTMPRGTYNTFNPRLVELWSLALEQGDVGTRIDAVESIGTSYEMGFEEVRSLASQVRAVAASEDEPLVLRLQAVRTLHLLDDRESLPILFTLNKTGKLGTVLETDPVLAAWKHQAAADVWLVRLSDETLPLSLRRSAINSLVTIEHTAASAALMDVVRAHGDRAAARIASARGLAALKADGLVAAARDLAGHPDLMSKLLAVELLSEYTAGDAVPVLVTLADDPSTAVATAAMKRLLVIDPAAAADIASKRMTTTDDGLRMLCAQVLATEKSERAVKHFVKLMDDPHPDIRNYVGDRLIELEGMPSRRDAVVLGVTEALRNWGMSLVHWGGVAQASRVLGVVDFETASNDLLRVVRSHQRHETRMAALTALRRLRVTDTLRPLLEHAKKLTNVRAESGMMAGTTGAEIAQIHQMFGEMLWMDADALKQLRSYIPRDDMVDGWARGAAIWSLGKMYEGNYQADLASQFISRMNDLGSPMGMPPPEPDPVRFNCAIALARMNAKEAVSHMRTHVVESRGAGAPEIFWAISKLTGKPMPVRKDVAIEQRHWFIEPMVERASAGDATDDSADTDESDDTAEGEGGDGP